MKHFIVIFCMLSLTSFGQYYTPGKLSTIVNGSSVEIRIDSAWRNCGALYDEQVFFYGQSMTWLQVDHGWCYGCICLFNYSVTIDSLNSGIYEVVVYYTGVSNEIVYDSITGTWVYTHIPCDTTYLGTTFFTISNSTFNNPVKVDSSATPCLLTKIISNLNRENSPYPNPATDIIHIPLIKNVNEIELTDIMGNQIKIEPLKLEGESLVIDLSSLSSGMYLLKRSSKIYKILKL